jgi:hypothetical protein
MAPYSENSAKDLISRFVDSIGIRDDKGIIPFVRAWGDIVGPDLAAHSQVLDIRNGAVLVGLDHPAWLQRMHMDRSRIVAIIRRRFPVLEIRYLHMTVVDRLDPAVTMKQETDTDVKEFKVDEKEEMVPSAEKAADDHDFMKRLQSLEEAIRRRNSDVD